MIYLNQASTTFPKPNIVRKAYIKAFDSIPFGENRSNLNLEEENLINSCRKNIGILFGIKNIDDIYFSSSSTASFNDLFRILNLCKGNIIISCFEHNSVVRPLYNFENITDDIRVVPCDEYGNIKPVDIENLIDINTKAIIINHCSNVTGNIQDLRAISSIVKKYQLLFIVDASQSGGCIPVKTEEFGIDILVFTGHKGLFGVQGTGGYYLKNSKTYRSCRYGGTGSQGLKYVYEKDDKTPFEVGTPNFHGLSALNAGVKFILDTGIDVILKTEMELINKLINGLRSVDNVVIYTSPFDCKRGPIVSFNIKGLSSFDVGYILENNYGIIIRAGYHCAPLIHKYLKTENCGTVRVSVSIFNTTQEIEAVINAVKDIVETLKL
jgi:cysteine desulfurase family protein